MSSFGSHGEELRALSAFAREPVRPGRFFQLGAKREQEGFLRRERHANSAFDASASCLFAPLGASLSNSVSETRSPATGYESDC